MSSTIFATQLLNSITFAALLFIVASGFTLIFGLMRIVNLAHGALYLLGGYCGLSVALHSGSFFLGVAGGAAFAGVAGFLLSRFLLPFVHGDELAQVLLTLGAALALGDIALVIWGGEPLRVPVPDVMRGPIRIAGLFYPRYRFFVLVSGLVIFAGLWLLIYRTKIGALIRAGVDDREMVEAIGIDINKVFLLVFVVGTGLA